MKKSQQRARTEPKNYSCNVCNMLPPRDARMCYHCCSMYCYNCVKGEEKSKKKMRCPICIGNGDTQDQIVKVTDQTCKPIFSEYFTCNLCKKPRQYEEHQVHMYGANKLLMEEPAC